MHFENGRNRNFEGLVTLTLTSDDLKTYIVEFVSTSSFDRHIDQACTMKNGWTYVRTYVRTDRHFDRTY